MPARSALAPFAVPPDVAVRPRTFTLATEPSPVAPPAAPAPPPARPALVPLPLGLDALLAPTLDALAREAVLHQPARSETTWDIPLRTMLARMRAHRRLALAGAPATTLPVLTHLAADAAIARHQPTVLVISGEPPARVLRRVLAWQARLPHEALVDGALDSDALRGLGRVAARLSQDVPLAVADADRRLDRLAEQLRGAVRWLTEHLGATRDAPGLLALSLQAATRPLVLNDAAGGPLRDFLCDLAHDPRIQLRVALPFRNGVPIVPPLPQLPVSWRSLLDATTILTGWPLAGAPVGGLTLHLERHVDGAVARAHAELHRSARLLPLTPSPPSGL